VNAQTLKGTGQLPKFEEDLFAAKKGGQGDADMNADTAALTSRSSGRTGPVFDSNQ
jgi:seryl-tRNA synthetase